MWPAQFVCRYKPSCESKLALIVKLTKFYLSRCLCIVFAVFLGTLGTTVFLFFVSFYSVEHGILDNRMAFYLVPIINAGSLFGRLLPNAISDKTGSFNIVTPCAFITGIIIFCLIVVHNTASMYNHTCAPRRLFQWCFYRYAPCLLHRPHQG